MAARLRWSFFLLLLPIVAFLFRATTIQLECCAQALAWPWRWHRSSKTIFVVTDYGVMGDGVHDDTAAMRRLLQSDKACRKHECEREEDRRHGCPCRRHIVIPKSVIVKTLPLNLTSHTTLQVDGTLFAIPSVSGWPIMPPNPIYGQSEDSGSHGFLVNQYQSYIYAENAHDITITGTGLIDGNGPFWWNLFTNRTLVHGGRPNLIQTVNCSGVELTGVTLKDAPFWTVHPMQSRDIYIHHMRIRAPLYAPNVDGIDPDSCQNVLVEYTDVACGDGASCVSIRMRCC